MPDRPMEMHSQRSAEGALQVLETFATSASVSFDRGFTSRAMKEAESAIAGDDAQAWARRLVDVGASLNLRVRCIECTLKEALAFAEQGTPVAFCVSLENGDLCWRVIESVKGSKVRVRSADPVEAEYWCHRRQLQREIGLPHASARRWFVIGQPALACQSDDRPTRHRTGEEPLQPLTRLFGLIRPERKDLWIVVVFSLVVGVLALATPIAVEALVNTVAFGQYLQPVVVLALILFTFLSFAAALRGLITYVVEVFQRRLFIRVVEDLAYRLPRVKTEEFDQRDAQQLVNQFFDVVTLQKTASALLLDGIAIVLQTVIGMAVLAFYHPFLLGFDVLMVASIAFVIFALGKGAVATAIKESKAKYALAGWLEELAKHKTAFKLHAGSQFALERADTLAVNWLNMRRKHFRVVMRQILFALGLQAVATTLLLGLGGWLVILGELTLGQLVAAELIVMMIVGSFAKLGKHMESYYDLMASVDKLGMLFDLAVESHDKLLHVGSSGPARLTLSSVGYAYRDQEVVKDLSIDIMPGESVAITGCGGSGKSTLIDLVCGLRTPTSGHVEMDGYDVREIRPDSVREHVALTRDIEIFHGSIDENVHMNRPNLQTKDVRDALAAVGLLDDVQKLPDGLKTVLQSGGIPWSTSQARRLMIARAIAGRPRLFVIDAALDGLPNNEIHELLKTLMVNHPPWTFLIVSNRRQVIEACDRVLQLDESPANDPADG